MGDFRVIRVLASDRYFAGGLDTCIGGCRVDTVEAWIRENAGRACNRLGLMLFDAEFNCLAIILNVCLELGVGTVFEKLGVVVWKICVGVCRQDFIAKCEEVFGLCFQFD